MRERRPGPGDRGCIEGEPRRDPPSGAMGACLHRAAEQRHALAHADQPATRLAGMAQRPARHPTRPAVVDDLDLERVGEVADRHRGPRVGRVLQRVGQRLLNDPVGRQLDPRVERPRCRRSPAARLADLSPGPARGAHPAGPGRASGPGRRRPAGSDARHRWRHPLDRERGSPASAACRRAPAGRSSRSPRARSGRPRGAGPAHAGRPRPGSRSRSRGGSPRRGARARSAPSRRPRPGPPAPRAPLPRGGPLLDRPDVAPPLLRPRAHEPDDEHRQQALDQARQPGRDADPQQDHASDHRRRNDGRQDPGPARALLGDREQRDERAKARVEGCRSRSAHARRSAEMVTAKTATGYRRRSTSGTVWSSASVIPRASVWLKSSAPPRIVNSDRAVSAAAMSPSTTSGFRARRDRRSSRGEEDAVRLAAMRPA